MAKTHHKVWLDGRIVAAEEANLSVFTLTALRGTNVYEGMRAYWSEEKGNLFVWELDAHLERLFQSMRIMRMTPPFDYDGFKDAVVSWCRANEFREDVHLRLVAYVGEVRAGGMAAYRPEDVTYGAFIFGGPQPHAKDLEEGIHVSVSSWRRITDDTLPPRVKAGANYQNNRLVAMEAATNGYDDGIILNRDGTVAELTGACVMLVRGDDLITPPVTAGILESITRRALLRMFETNHNRKPFERAVDRTELYVADEALCCGSAKEVTPILSVDRIDVGTGTPGPITRRLQESFFRAVRGQDADWEGALTPVY